MRIWEGFTARDPPQKATERFPTETREQNGEEKDADETLGLEKRNSE